MINGEVISASSLKKKVAKRRLYDRIYEQEAILHL